MMHLITFKMCRARHLTRLLKCFFGLLLHVSIVLIAMCGIMSVLNVNRIVQGVNGALPVAAAPRVRCETPDMIPNGSYRLRRNNMIMRVSCNVGFQLQGYRLISCIRGKWYEEKPVCAKKGCKEILQAPENGRIHIQNDLKAILYCLDDYTLAGNRLTFCNGTHWDRPIGHCRPRKTTVQHFCDFETDDVCGWVYEPHDGLEWKRVLAARIFRSFRTGPRYDHTTQTSNGGHYMLMESLTRQNIPVILTSPIYEKDLSLKTACCFQFYYFMYGSGVGTLHVLVKPISISVTDILKDHKNLIKFQKTGNQNNLWNEAHFSIEELEEDFQIVFVAQGGLGHLSDIAIDDVHLMTGQECKVFDDGYVDYNSTEHDYDYKTTSETYDSIYDTQSCAGRCNDTNPNKGIMYVRNHLMELCSCTLECEELDSCCPDFKTVCLNEMFMESSTTEIIPLISRQEIMSDEVIPSMLEQPDPTNPTNREIMPEFINSTTVTISPPPTASVAETANGIVPIVLKSFTTAMSTGTTAATRTTTPIRTTVTHITGIPTTRTASTTTTRSGMQSTLITFSITSLTPFNATAPLRPLIKMRPTTPITTPTTTTKTTTTPTTMPTTITERRTTARIRADEPTTYRISQEIEMTQIPSTPTTMPQQPPSSTKIRRTTIIPYGTTEPMGTIYSRNNSNEKKSRTTSTFIMNPDNQVYPDDFQSHTTLVYYLFILVLLTIVTLLLYRRFGGTVAAWYRIHFRIPKTTDAVQDDYIFNDDDEDDDDERDGNRPVNGHLIPETTPEGSSHPKSTTLTPRSITRDFCGKMKLHYKRRSKNGNDMKMPLWRNSADGSDNNDDDNDGDNDDGNVGRKNCNGVAPTTDRLLTEL